MILTLDRLLLLAIVMSLISADGIYRAWQQRQDGRIGHKLFLFFAGALIFGSGLAWFGFIIEWIGR